MFSMDFPIVFPPSQCAAGLERRGAETAAGAAITGWKTIGKPQKNGGSMGFHRSLPSGNDCYINYGSNLPLFMEKLTNFRLGHVQ